MPDVLGHDDLAALFALPDEAAKEAALAYLCARRYKEAAEEQLREASSDLAHAEMALMRALDEAGTKGVKLERPEGTAVLTAPVSHYYRLSEGLLDTDTGLRAYVVRNGGGEMMRTFVHPSTFTAWCRALVESGQRLHPAITEVKKRGVRLCFK